MGNLKEFSSATVLLSKNPLGVLSLFLIFLYALAVSVVVLPASTLSEIQKWPLLIFLVVFPILVFLGFYRLVTHYHKNLYSPSDFKTDESFIQMSVEIQNQKRKYIPFKLSAKSNSKFLNDIEGFAEKWKQDFENLNYATFFLLHSWFFEREEFCSALRCIDMAISLECTSKAYSYRSATLRMMGRNEEAKHSAYLSLALDPINVDADFNLAVIFNSHDNKEKVHLHLSKVLNSNFKDHYIERIKRFFSESELNGFI